MNDGGDRGQDREPCRACKHLRQICGPACILAPYFPPDDAFSERIFARVIKTYSIGEMTELISGLPKVADHDQHAAADPSDALDRSYHMPPMTELISGLPNVADHDQHAAADLSDALGRSYHMPVIDALMKEHDYCQRRLNFIIRMLAFISLLRQLRLYEEDRNALGSAASSSRPSHEPLQHENVVAGDGKGKIELDIDLDKDPAS